jgi:hypothetical protein
MFITKGNDMAIVLNEAAVDRVKYLIEAGEVTSLDSDWNEEKPTPTEIEEFLEAHDMKEYGEWFLGKNDQFDAEVKEHYEYPYGDLREVQRCALVHSHAQAEQKGDKEIMHVIKELITLIDERK